MAREWRSRLVDLGEVGHLNPASGFGEWPMAEKLIAELHDVPGRCWIGQRIAR
jgi:predicted alpha/beta hydrolase family esterase